MATDRAGARGDDEGSVPSSAGKQHTSWRGGVERDVQQLAELRRQMARQRALSRWRFIGLWEKQ